MKAVGLLCWVLEAIILITIATASNVTNGGCYTDSTNFFGGFFFFSPANSISSLNCPQYCIDHCQIWNSIFAFAAVRTSFCYCLSAATVFQPSTACILTCPGNASTMCGSLSSANVYNIPFPNNTFTWNAAASTVATTTSPVVTTTSTKATSTTTKPKKIVVASLVGTTNKATSVAPTVLASNPTTMVPALTTGSTLSAISTLTSVVGNSTKSDTNSSIFAVTELFIFDGTYWVKDMIYSLFSNGNLTTFNTNFSQLSIPENLILSFNRTTLISSFTANVTSATNSSELFITETFIFNGTTWASDSITSKYIVANVNSNLTVAENFIYNGQTWLPVTNVTNTAEPLASTVEASTVEVTENTNFALTSSSQSIESTSSSEISNTTTSNMATFLTTSQNAPSTSSIEAQTSTMVTKAPSTEDSFSSATTPSTQRVKTAGVTTVLEAVPLDC